MPHLPDAKQYEMYRMILENLPMGVNVVDKEGYLIYANKSSAKYVLANSEEMVGKHITVYYPKAALMEVIGTRKPVLDMKASHGNGRTFVVTAFPLYFDGQFSGGFATFRDITEIEELSKRLEFLELELAFTQADDIFDSFVGKGESLKEVLEKALRSVASIGGPRHSIILGETGTGKTMLAQAMYFFAKKNNVIKADAPFIEVNCAQFSNADIAAMEIFGTEKGAFTGASEKPGLVELANGGVLFLDEAHALVHHQTMLLKLIESGVVRRIGGRTEREVQLIVIAASSKDLRKEFLPELYQRLGQYQLELPPLRKRSVAEKRALFNFFVNQYCHQVRRRHNINFSAKFSDQARELILNGRYERNVRQLRDVINASIDAVAPLIGNLADIKKEISVIVQVHNIPYLMMENGPTAESIERFADSEVDEIIRELTENGMGARRIAAELQSRGYPTEYYHVAYRQKKYKKELGQSS